MMRQAFLSPTFSLKRLLKRAAGLSALLVFLSGLFSGSVVYAQSSLKSIRISGFITDSNHKALELVNVWEQYSQQGCSSDENGYYDMTLPARDTVILHFSCLSYKTAVRIVPVEMNHLRLNVMLQNSSQTLNDVSVSARQHQQDMMQSLDPSAIRLLPDPSGGSIEALLVTFAGVNSNNELSTQYSVRGGNYDENLVYVNGTEIYRPLLIRSGQQEGLSFVNPQLTRSVQFSAGGFDARYGDKSASVLDIRYKKPERFEASVNASLLGVNAYAGSASRDGKFTQIHGIRYKTNAYLLGSLQTQGEYKPSYFDYQTYLTYTFKSGLELSFLGNLSQNVYEFTPESRKTEMGTFNTKYRFEVYFDGMEKDLFRTGFGALNLHSEKHRKLKTDWTLSAFRTDEQENYDITGQYWLSEMPVLNHQADTANANFIGVGTYHEHARNHLQANVISLQHKGQWDAGHHHLQWGLGYQLEKITDRIREWEVLDSAGYSLPYSDREILFTENLSSRQRMDNSRLTSYLQDTWKARTSAGLITVTGGLRANYWSGNGQLLLSPRASLGFIPAWEKDFTFRLAGGIYYQAPFYKELRDTVITDGLSNVVLNTGIQAPKSTQIIAGGDYHFIFSDRPFIFTAEAYYKHTDHLIPYVVDNVRIRYTGQNHGTGSTLGCDFKLFGEFVPGTDSWISLSLMDSRQDFGDFSIPAPNEQRYNLSMFFRDYLPRNPKYSMSLRFIWADGLCFGPPSMDFSYATTRMKAYRRVDAGLSRLLVNGEDKILKSKIFNHIGKIWISLDCFNLFGIQNTNSYYWVRDINNCEWAVPNYLTGRQLNLSLSVDFR